MTQEKLNEALETEANRIRITEIKAMQPTGTAGQSLIKVETDAGL